MRRRGCCQQSIDVRFRITNSELKPKGRSLAADGLASPTIYIPENGLISLNVPLDPLRLGSIAPDLFDRGVELYNDLGSVRDRFETALANPSDPAALSDFNTASTSKFRAPPL